MWLPVVPWLQHKLWMIYFVWCGTDWPFFYTICSFDFYDDGNHSLRADADCCN